jgi:hypothetical protein
LNTVILLSRKINILFSIVRALRRAGSFDFLTDAEFDKIIAVYDSLMKVKQTERAMEDVAKRENPKYAVVPWGEYERRIVEAYGHASINT